jgi:hypothetical protein
MYLFHYPTLSVSNFGSLKWCVTGIQSAAHSDREVTELYVLCLTYFTNIMHVILSMDTIHRICQIFPQHISFKGHIMCCNSLLDILLPPWLCRQIFPFRFGYMLCPKWVIQQNTFNSNQYAFHHGQQQCTFAQKHKFHMHPKSHVIFRMYEEQSVYRSQMEVKQL